MYNVDYSKGPIYQITAANKAGTNWFEELFKKAPIQSYNIGMQGGSDKSTYFFSLGYFNQQGTLIDTYLKRYMARMNTSFQLTKGISVGENFYTFYKDNPQISYFGENRSTTIIVNNRSYRCMTARVTGRVQTDRNWVTLKIRWQTRNAQKIIREVTGRSWVISGDKLTS